MRLGSHITEATRVKLSAVHMGHAPTHTIPHTSEARAKMSVAGMGHTISLETRAKISEALWRGGELASRRKEKAERRLLGFVPLNIPFLGCEGHHVDHDRIIYIPGELHRSISHNGRNGRNMEQINALAFQWLEQAVIHV